MPSEFSQLKQLIYLGLSSNKIYGEIPGTLSQYQELQVIQLDQNSLTGSIPTSFGNLSTLSMLNLSHNNLSGFIPVTLINLEFLVHLDLSYNCLHGGIPISGVFANATAVSLNGNLGLCGGAMDLHMLACPAAYRTSRRPYLLLLSFGKKFPRVSYKDLAQATGNFSDSNIIGRGSFGSVYRGKLTQAKIQVAIKVFDLEIRFADKSFFSECEALRTIRHRNLLPVLTACSTIDNSGSDFKALIYEFMPNGNLNTWLHQKSGGIAPKILGLTQRISICVDIADALAYLHHDCGMPIVHCDLKPTNILLDENMNAYLGDFGIASLIVDSRPIAAGRSGSISSFVVTGSIGYIAPEYAQSVHSSTYRDVYSFGMVLLEMLIGKRPTDSMFEEDLSITSFVKRNFPDQMLHIIDARLREECKGFVHPTSETENQVYRCMLSLVQIALSCTHVVPRERMNMREVAVNLHSIRRSYVAAIKREQTMVH
ncbi:unnamed protein product [Urochloa humidicola]